MVATKTETGSDPKSIDLDKESKPKKVEPKKAATKKVAKKATKKKATGKWVPICMIASAQDYDEATGKFIVSQSKALLEQHTGTMAIRTTKV